MEKDNKIKVMIISDHPYSPSGVGNQTRYMMESLLRSGKFKVVSIAGAVKHENYNVQKTEEWGDDLKILPVDGYGDANAVRSVIRIERPDILWIMTDPRFYEWLWSIENEVRPLVPLVYYHVWDNYPYPTYNAKFYNSNDMIVSISKLTNDIVKTVSPDVDLRHVPHAVDPLIFNKKTDLKISELRKNIFEDNLYNSEEKEKMIFFWNNRNARRKQSGSLIYWYKELIDKVGHDKCVLLMHTDPKDPHGQDLEAIVRELDLVDGQVLLSRQKLAPEKIAELYNIADCTINISDAEGFGLSALESMACGTPIIVNLTGGLQDQVTDGENWFGIGIEPVSKAIIGSQQVPFIYEDRLNSDDVVSAMHEMYELWLEKEDDEQSEYKKMAKLGLENVDKNFNFGKLCESWVEIMSEVHEKHGSWDNRKNYKSWECIELT